MEVYFRKSRWGWVECTLHQLLMATLKIESRMTRKLDAHLALNPTATMPHAASPKMETRTLPIDHFPWRMKPMNRKMSNTRPVSWKLEA